MERILPNRIYLDHAATTPMTGDAREAVARSQSLWANPSSPHAEGRVARAALEAARRQIGAAYGWCGETILTSGASESLDLVMSRATAARRVISAVEHDAAIRAAGETAIVVPVGPNGVIDLVALADVLGGGERALVCVQWANSETGVRQPIAAVADIVHAAGGLLVVDAAQMPAGPDLAGRADFVVLSGHKRGGPVGIGALLVRELATLRPSGGQERGYRPGTENLPGALGYAAALAEPEKIATLAVLRARLDDAIVRSGGEIVAATSDRYPAIGSYRLPGVAAAAQLILLDSAGFAVSAGSACSSGSMKPSHVLSAMSWDETSGREVIRVSFGRTTTVAEVEAFIVAWRQMAKTSKRFAA